MVVVVGGGYAGRMALVRLRSAGVPATLVDARPDWVERTRLHEAAVRGVDVTYPLAPFAARVGAGFVQGRVARVEDRAVLLDDGRALPFQACVVAAGSTSAALDDPAAIHGQLRALSDGARVSVVGAGLTGIELATEIAESRPGLRVTLHGPLRDLSAAGERVLADTFAHLGLDHDPAYADAPDADLVLRTVGFRAPAWLASSGLPVDADGRVIVDGALRVPGRAVVAAGDCAATPLRMSCASAMPMGCHAADTAARLLRGDEPRPLAFGFFARCVSLGRSAGLFQLVHPDDRPRATAFGGRTGATIKEWILTSVARMPEWEAGAGVSLYAWPRAPLTPALTA
jgi:NADH:ubiquinone reductase (H+-translocating)